MFLIIMKNGCGCIMNHYKCKSRPGIIRKGFLHKNQLSYSPINEVSSLTRKHHSLYSIINFAVLV